MPFPLVPLPSLNVPYLTPLSPLINDYLSNQGDKPKQRPQGAIELRDVMFAYPSRPTIQVCNGYNLTIKPGESLALCGPSGAGTIPPRNNNMYTL